MNDKIVIYQKPTCSKCKATLALLDASGKPYDAIDYYEAPLTETQLQVLIEKLGLPVRAVLRTDEPAAQKLASASDSELIRAMAANPDLIQRPIVVRGGEAKLCRPPENVLTLLK
ncbi:MAG: arsenate reductase family protein [Nitrosomonas sp.]|nr:MAG: arsenate reductase family protein [Nitrosomonas sp.]